MAAFEAALKKILPERHQIVIGYLSTLTGSFFLYKAFKAPSPPAPAIVSAPSSSTTEPTVDNFAEWIQNEQNVTAWINAQGSGAKH